MLVGELSVTPFTKKHDAVDPHSFIVTYKGTTVGVFTDVGIACKQVEHYFKKCHAAFLEANYCDDMLANGSYPYFLKQRISSDKGHLSNDEALKLFIKHRSPQLSHLILSHLSKNNNSPALVNRIFKENAGTTEIIVASRHKETPVYCIGNTIPKYIIRKYKRSSEHQLSLF